MPSVVVAGATGFAGALAAALLWRHPDFDLRAVTARSETGRRLDDVYPHHRVPLQLEPLDLAVHGDVDAAVIAYPHGASAPVAAGFRQAGARVVDLSADFRLDDVGVYEEWYVPHLHAELLATAVYGLPELHRDAIPAADLVACPGCFPTAALLALAPLAQAGLIADVVIDAKTGVSGAGRTPTDKTHFVSVAENVVPYGVGRHRHMPELDQELARMGNPVIAAFTAHLLPLDQGELLSCYVTPTRPVDQAELDALVAERYADEPFIELVGRPPGVRDVRETNFARIHAHADRRTGKLFVFAAIDNLWKGTSSQAVQNLNLMFGLPETAGLL
ncbi:MAG TPA: N-acetyl-gamma-glutamyl-phosphate reductase [Solirubrobacteraceae bacterium]|jgi:N-acetyl-gamma-glutamyl-phosphate reductase|nr:N-acetyl-gamma-glutamyl-phosphate reductase [Solirubrobacteraceae bacterium]